MKFISILVYICFYSSVLLYKLLHRYMVKGHGED